MAYLLSRNDAGQRLDKTDLTIDELMPGDVVVSVSHSTVNYKDGLAITGKGRIVRRWPMIPGVDLAGTVESSEDPAFSPGDPVIVNGWGLGETHYGGFARKARLDAAWPIPLPDRFSPHQAMAIGTAGYTAMLCVMALERAGVTVDRGPVLVSGASGGVGSVAVAVLARLGYEVVASTGRLHEADYLRALGAAQVMDRAELSEPGKVLGSERWAGAIDSVGSHTLANILAMTRYRGTVAACGLAQGMDLPTSVAPFILRGITLVGIDSARAPKAERIDAWRRLGDDLDPDILEKMTQTITLGQVPEAAERIIEGKVRGRIVVDVAG